MFILTHLRNEAFTMYCSTEMDIIKKNNILEAVLRNVLMENNLRMQKQTRC